MPNTFDGTSIQRADNSVWLDVKEGLFEHYEVRGKDTVVPGDEGEIPRNRVPGKLRIVLKGWIRGSSWSAYWTLVKEMKTLFDPARAPATLSVPLDDGTTGTIEARPVNIIPAGDEAIGAAREWSVELRAVDPPYWTFT